MSTTELNHFLNSFERPHQVSNAAWQSVLSQAKNIWQSYLNGEDWTEQVDILCKESYLMLVNPNGQLIVQDDSLFNYVKNKQVKGWRKRLEEIAFKAIRDRRYDKAERYFTKAIKVDESVALNYYRRALIRMKLSKNKLALEDVSQAIVLNPNVHTFYLKRAQLYRILDIDYKAMSDLNRAIKIQPDSADAYDIRGKYRLSLGDRAGGKMDLLKAEDLRQDGKSGDSEIYGLKAA